MKRFKILFVCLGNICRSPAAEGIMKSVVQKHNADWHIDSAGTYAGHKGELPDRRMYRAALERGYVLDHRSRPVSMSDFLDFDLIVAMDDDNYETLVMQAPNVESVDKIVRMRDFFGEDRQETYVPDPYYSGSEGFTLVMDLLEDACENLFQRYHEKQN